jgi:hypothetical protein
MPLFSISSRWFVAVYFWRYVQATSTGFVAVLLFPEVLAAKAAFNGYAPQVSSDLAEWHFCGFSVTLWCVHISMVA